jgi:phosphoribosylamine--glycine ligase
MSNKSLIVGIIGKDGRTSAIQESLEQSALVAECHNMSTWKNRTVAEAFKEILEKARTIKPDIVIIGPEEPLAEGTADLLKKELGIECVGPTKKLAQLETSKAFTRELVTKYKIAGDVQYRVFHDMNGIADFLRMLDAGYVVKPDGLTGGKGVRISDEHLFSIDEALSYCESLFEDGHHAVVVEEKLEGEEFSLQSFCDGTHVRDMIVVQDHKRAFDGDTGPNTGGMGSYSCADHSLPFLRSGDLAQASAINAAISKALLQETGEKYKGILYGGFMATARGVKLLEYNARFGDPETLNVLSLLRTDFGAICQAIVRETLHELPITFARKASVCKYIVPRNYPDHPVKQQRIELHFEPDPQRRVRKYLAAVEEREDGLYLTGSRAVAFVGIGRDLAEAEARAEAAASRVQGPVFHRRDIGTAEVIARRVAHMRGLYANTRERLVSRS